ncbi:MAG: type II secretion system F family protein [Candidatus Omnitrophica bacterium]|nr:type II secretion system F family protein [Candidatus Omnitrophota bacterium]
MNFKYKVRDKYGKLVAGIMTGDTKDSVAKHLSDMGYVPISIEELKEAKIRVTKSLDFFKKIKISDINLFTRQLLTLQRAGVSLLMSLNTLEKQTRDRVLKDVLKSIAIDVEGGLSLSEAMARHPKIFNEFYVNMIKAGEISGTLEEILARLAEFGEKEEGITCKIKAATRYPLMTLGALSIAFLVVVTFVIPKFAVIFSQFKTALPLPTRILLALNFAIQHYWYIIIGVAIALAVVFLKYINTTGGRLRWDWFKLRVPVFGNIVTMLSMSRFALNMSILMRSGIPILQALDLTSRTVGNSVISRAIDNMAVGVREGKGLSEPMRISGVFSPIVVQMVAVGEDTGKADELLMNVSQYYDEQADYTITNLTTLIEPFLIVFLGVMVLTMALAIFLPMWNLIGLFKH